MGPLTPHDSPPTTSPATIDGMERSSESTVTSRDGTSIGYYRMGTGPGLILVHGAGQTAESFRALARDLSPDFTIYVPDRRGRGMSPSYGAFRGLRSEMDDLSALLDTTRARYVFGLSAGAVIAIETALARPEIARLALYEPPLSFDGVVHGAWAPKYERELAAGRPGRALVAVLKGTSDRTAFRFMPGFVLGPVLDFIIKHTGEQPVQAGNFSPREIIPTLHYDVQTVSDAAGPLERFAGVDCDVLLLSGSRSARNLIASVNGLSRVLPNAKRVSLHGVGHTAADNSKQPHLVAAELRDFFRDSGGLMTDNPAPTMLGFEWTPRTVDPRQRLLPGDLWCVRDAFSTLMRWLPGSEEWSRFIEAPDGPADMERLVGRLGLDAYDPEYPEHAAVLRDSLDRPGIACYKFHSQRMEHCQYQPHLRHFQPLPPQYIVADPEPELFQLIVDRRQGPHVDDCPQCQVEV